MNAKVIANGFVTAVVKRFAGPFWIRRRWLKKTQWLDASELEELQLQLLQKLVRHCYRTVPYYRDFMNLSGVKVDDIRTLDDIKRFPILTKKDVLDAGDSIVCASYPKWLLRNANTSGTTGTPLMIRRSLFSIENEHAFVRRQWEWAGLQFKDVVAYLKGMVVAKPGSKRKVLYGYDPFLKELHLSTYHLSKETAKEYIKAMKRYNVKALYGYPSSVYPVAKTCLDCGIDFRLHSVLLTAENLHESHRETIARAFRCKVYDFYGTAERVCYIFTCDHANYHVVPEYGLTEYLPVEGAEDGRDRIIGTGFWNKAMPLIRYDTGDMVIRSSKTCPCGRAFPVIETIIGRECDVITTPTGKVLGPSIMTALVYVVCGASNFVESQIIQDSPEHVVIEYVPTRDCSARYLSELEAKLTEYFPDDLSFDLKEVTAVQRTQGGKVKAVVSQITS